MGTMSEPSQNPTPAHQRGAVDLSSLSNASAAQPGAPQGQTWVTELTEAGFDQVAQQSMQFPVVLELYSPRDPQGEQVSQALASATNAAQGRWLLARVDVDAEPRIAQALQATAVPYVLALIGGQAAPLFQGTRSPDEINAVLNQLAEVAMANGLTGRAPAQAGAAPTQGAVPEPVADPRFDAADAALERGDYAQAVAEFDKVLAATPNDAEALAGRAQAALLARSVSLVPEQVVAEANAKPDDVEAQLAAADLEVLQGATEPAFERLVGVIRDLRGEDREPVRVRLLELFQTQPAGDPVVAKARRALSSALFSV